MVEVCLLLALATPMLLASTPAPTPHLVTRTDGNSVLDLPGTHADGGAARAATPAPSAPHATARVRRAFRPPQRAFTKPIQECHRASSIATRPNKSL
jgi:hypothetical protein